MFNELITNAVTQIRATVPGLLECRGHDGPLDEKRLKELTVRTPAVHVGCLSVLKVDDLETGEKRATLLLAAFVVAKPGRKSDRDTSARQIVEQLLVLIQDARWGLPGVASPEGLRADPLGNTSTDRSGVSVWGVSWRQAVTIGAPFVFDEDMETPQTILVGQAPEIGTDHEGDYETLQGADAGGGE